jgi:hypothetical protein
VHADRQHHHHQMIFFLFEKNGRMGQVEAQASYELARRNKQTKALVTARAIDPW